MVSDTKSTKIVWILCFLSLTRSYVVEVGLVLVLNSIVFFVVVGVCALGFFFLPVEIVTTGT